MCIRDRLDKDQIEKVLLTDLDVEDKVIRLIQKANNRGHTYCNVIPDVYTHLHPHSKLPVFPELPVLSYSVQD